MTKMLLTAIFIYFAAINSIAQSLNPDVTQATIKQTICVSGWTNTIRPSSSYTSKLKARELKAGIKLGIYTPDATMAMFVLDHDVPLQVGGAPKDPKNLHLQFKADGLLKDKIEALVRRRVCSGRITLAQGQDVFMSKRWRSYK